MTPAPQATLPATRPDDTRPLVRERGAQRGKRGFGGWLDDRLAGYVDFDPDAGYPSAADGVDSVYAIPRARRRGVATSAVPPRSAGLGVPFVRLLQPLRQPRRRVLRVTRVLLPFFKVVTHTGRGVPGGLIVVVEIKRDAPRNL